LIFDEFVRGNPTFWVPPPQFWSIFGSSRTKPSFCESAASKEPRSGLVARIEVV
jgi:hypothetical protein